MLSHNRVLGLVVALALVYASARAFNSCFVDLGSYQVDLNPLATFPSNFSVTSTNGQNIVFRVCSNMTCPNTPYGSVDSGVCQRQSSGSSTSWGVYKSWMQASPLWDHYQSGISLRLFGGTNGAQAEINIYCDPNAWTPYNFSAITPFDQHYPAIISMTHQSGCRAGTAPTASPYASPSYWNPPQSTPVWTPPSYWNPQPAPGYWNPPSYWNPQPEPSPGYWNPPSYWNPQPTPGYWNPPPSYWNPQPEPSPGYWNPPSYWNPQPTPGYWNPPPSYWNPPQATPASGAYAVASQLDFSPNNPTCGAGGRFTKNVWRFSSCTPHPTLQNTYYMVTDCDSNGMTVRYNLDPYCMDAYVIKAYHANVCTPREDRGATLLLGCQRTNNPSSKITTEDITLWKDQGLVETLPKEKDMKE